LQLLGFNTSFLLVSFFSSAATAALASADIIDSGAEFCAVAADYRGDVSKLGINGRVKQNLSGLFVR
jgi:hypothetical protein